MTNTGHQCVQAGCDRDATHLVVESHNLAMLFGSGAGLMCVTCAHNMTAVGGVSLSLDGFINAARDEHTGSVAA